MTSVVDPVRRHAAATPGAVALRDRAGDWSYDDLLAAATSFASTVLANGVRPGQHVVLIAPSVPEFVVAYLGIQCAGCVVVPMNTMSTREEIEYVLDDAEAVLVIAWHGQADAARSAATSAGVRFEELTALKPGAAAGGADLSVMERDRSDTAAILYTSGTTGRPKGAELTIGNILDAAEISLQIGRGAPTDRYATGLPLFHIFGQISIMMTALTAGASISLLAPFDPAGMLDLIRSDRITVMAGVPTMWNAMLHASAESDELDFASVRLAVSGGASLPSEVARAFESRFGCPVLEGYGMTETTSLATFNDIDRGSKTGSAGAPVPRMSLEVRDVDGSVVGEGEVGEIHLRGPSIMKRYWRRPEATAATVQDGWLRTGDLGRLDADGDLWIVDRLKDLIIRGGYNVYPGEVEEVLHEHPDVVEVAVVGVPDEYYGEEVAAVIVLRNGADLQGAAVTAWARERMSAYKIPRIVQFVPALPKGATGKILKRSIDTKSFRRVVQ